MESIWKMSNFNFQWTKTLYQNILSHIVFFFTLFKGYRCNIVICNNTKDNFLCRASDRSWRKKSNFTGFLGTNSRKNHPISWEFHGNFRANFFKKQLVKNGQFCGYFQGKFRWKSIGFALIRPVFSTFF